MALERDGECDVPIDAMKAQLRAGTRPRASTVSDRIAAEQRARLAALASEPGFGSRPCAPPDPDPCLWREVPHAKVDASCCPAGAEGASALGHRLPAGDESLGAEESPDCDCCGHAPCEEPSGGERAGELPGPGARMDRTERTASITPPVAETIICVTIDAIDLEIVDIIDTPLRL
jgi:hypothetical protein